jgi:hypothetical protein
MLLTRIMEIVLRRTSPLNSRWECVSVDTNSKKRSKGMDWLGLAAFGFFLLLVGAIWIAHFSDLNTEAEAFVNPDNWRLSNVTGNIAIPEPTRSYPSIAIAVMQFCFIFGAFEVVILVLRLVVHDLIGRIADAISGAAFWFSAGYFASLAASESIGFFAFLVGVVISGGLAIVASSIVKLLR